MIKISPARQAAFEILGKIATEKAFSAILLPKYEENLKFEDRALCHALVLGVLRNQILLDALIEHFSGKKIAKLDLPVVLALRLGLYQTRFLTKIPASAAVNESVNLVLAARLRSASGFVNAVLRKSERDKDFDLLENIEDSIEKLALKTSHPVWLLKKWQNEFGTEETEKLAHANNQNPPRAFRLTSKATDKTFEELCAAGAELIESKLVANAWRIAGATAKARELVARGEIYLQDEASQLVAHLANVSKSEAFLDACAAPGSKTSLVSLLQKNFQESQTQRSKIKDQRSNLFVAADLTAPRIKILRETIKKFAPSKIQIVQHDAEKSLPFAAEAFDCVLVDAPCSGTGTIRHNPEIRWHLEPTDFEKLAIKQLRILTNAANLVKIGGRIVYSTCSVEQEENEAVISHFLVEHPNYISKKINLPEKFLNAAGFARTFPQRDDVDGFFIAVLERQN